MPKGDHVYVDRGMYTHHGINCGDGTVIHYEGKFGIGKITRISCKKFADGKDVYIRRCYCYKFSPDEIVRRAERRLNEADYNLIFNNCEHFATDCTTGEPDSQQVGNSIVAAGASVASAARLGAISTTVPAAGILGSVGVITTLGLPIAVVAGGAVLVGGTAFKIFQKISYKS